MRNKAPEHGLIVRKDLGTGEVKVTNIKGHPFDFGQDTSDIKRRILTEGTDSIVMHGHDASLSFVKREDYIEQIGEGEAKAERVIVYESKHWNLPHYLAKLRE
tara:strand:- start:433 stop:741 length:309 start_codon:yes stop_codon:yes gene_type:complete